MPSDAKSYYSKVAKERIADGASNPDLQRAIQAGFDRKEQFQENWQTVNLSEFVDKFAPNATRYVQGVKIYFDSPQSELAIIADLSGYCRLGKRLPNSDKFLYLDKNGNDVRNVTLPNGKQTGRSKSQQRELTHFVIKKI
jgi:hypothetical protein